MPVPQHTAAASQDTAGRVAEHSRQDQDLSGAREMAFSGP